MNRVKLGSSSKYETLPIYDADLLKTLISAAEFLMYTKIVHIVQNIGELWAYKEMKLCSC